MENTSLDSALAYSTIEVSRLTGICLTNIRAAVRNGELRARYVGRKPVHLREDIEAWLASLPDVAPHRRKETRPAHQNSKAA
jgi:hypothetical protein